MRVTLAILILILSCVPSKGRTNWGFSNFSFFYGANYNAGYKTSHSLEFLYDAGHKSCTGRFYYGFALTANVNSRYSEFGIKGQINPFPFRKQLSRRGNVALHPYLFLQGNLMPEQPEKEPAQAKEFSFRPGLGAVLNLRQRGGVNVRSSIQLGYTLSGKKITDRVAPITVEFKIGVGINPWRIKGHAYWKKKESKGE